MNLPHYYIGIMSGTSMDGADAVLIRMNGMQWQAAEAHAFLPYPESLKTALLALQNVGYDELHRSQLLAQELAHLYHRVCVKLLQQTGLQAKDITALACHGQTVRHAPEQAYSIQLVNLALLAELTGILTIGDFRSRDLAAGGQGAPLVPAFHQAVFQDKQESRVVLNLGGIANISVLPSAQSGEAVFGFDTGVGNMLADAWTQKVWGQAYDADGKRAAQGVVLPDLLSRLLAHEYFTRPYPKSTGRELFALDYLSCRLRGDENEFDVLRTVVEFTAVSVADAIKQVANQAKHIFVCGGGVYNATLMHSLQQQLSDKIISNTMTLHLNPQWVEAAAFAWLGACWVNRVPSSPHDATGAKYARILGCAYQ